MQACTDPRGHKWVATSFRIQAGSTPVSCERCPVTGYRLDEQVVDQNLGQPGEELF